MPLTIRSGWTPKAPMRAKRIQSAGGPVTAQTLSPGRSGMDRRWASGSMSKTEPMAAPDPLYSSSGATTITSPCSATAHAERVQPQRVDAVVIGHEDLSPFGHAFTIGTARAGWTYRRAKPTGHSASQLDDLPGGHPCANVSIESHVCVGEHRSEPGRRRSNRPGNSQAPLPHSRSAPLESVGGSDPQPITEGANALRYRRQRGRVHHVS